MLLRSLLVGFSILIVSTSCHQDPAAGMAELDLMSYGMPIVIHAPEGADVRKMDLVVSKDILVDAGPDFKVQIFESNADTRDLAEIKQRMETEVRRSPYFSKILKEDASGFIYETQVDSNYVNFGFRHVRIQADKEYIFQQSLGGKFTQEAIESMYSAVQ